MTLDFDDFDTTSAPYTILSDLERVVTNLGTLFFDVPPLDFSDIYLFLEPCTPFLLEDLSFLLS